MSVTHYTIVAPQPAGGFTTNFYPLSRDFALVNGNGPQRYQQIFAADNFVKYDDSGDPTAIAILGPITQLAFRVGAAQGTIIGKSADCQINLSPSLKTVAQIQALGPPGFSTFANNIGSPAVTVFDSTVALNDSADGLYNLAFPFTTPFNYNGGALLVEFVMRSGWAGKRLSAFSSGGQDKIARVWTRGPNDIVPTNDYGSSDGNINGGGLGPAYIGLATEFQIYPSISDTSVPHQISGHGFPTDASGTVVTYGGIAATGVTLVSETLITLTVPSGTPLSTVPVVITFSFTTFNITEEDLVVSGSYTYPPTRLPWQLQRFDAKLRREET